MTTINPDILFDSTQYGFSQAVVATSGKMVFISGQVAWDRDQRITGEGNLESQTKKSMDNLREAIKAAGGALSDVVMLRIYTVNYKDGDGAIIGGVLREKFGSHLPASTWIGVQSLARPEFLIEIEAQAII